MGHRSFQCPRNIDASNAQAHVVNIVQDGSINAHQLADELATFATKSEEALSFQGIDHAADETKDHIPEEEELYYTLSIARRFNAEGSTPSNIHIIYCVKRTSIPEFGYQAAKSIHYAKDVSDFALCV